MSLAQTLRARLAELGWTQARLADEAGVSLNLIESLLAGTRRDPHLSTAARLASALRVPLERLAAEWLPGSRRRWRNLTAEDDAEFVRMWRAGESYHAFVERFGINRWSICAIRRRLGLVARPSGRPRAT